MYKVNNEMLNRYLERDYRAEERDKEEKYYDNKSDNDRKEEENE